MFCAEFHSVNDILTIKELNNTNLVAIASQRPLNFRIGVGIFRGIFKKGHKRSDRTLDTTFKEKPKIIKCFFVLVYILYIHDRPKRMKKTHIHKSVFRQRLRTLCIICNDKDSSISAIWLPQILFYAI